MLLTPTGLPLLFLTNSIATAAAGVFFTDLLDLPGITKGYDLAITKVNDLKQNNTGHIFVNNHAYCAMISFN